MQETAIVRRSVKSAESNRIVGIKPYNEICPEVDGVTYRSGVYKMTMVRMCVKSTDELAKVRVYNRLMQKCMRALKSAVSEV
jgi:hypothetical protein